MTTKKEIIVYIFIYFCICVIGSEIKALSDSCDKTFPMDYIVYTNLFCEIKSE